MAMFLYHSDGQDFGPFTAAELQARARAGHVDPEDLVWKLGTTKKVRARSVKGLFESLDTQRPKPELNRFPIVRETKPAMFTRSFIACFADSLMLLSRLSLTSRRFELDEPALQGDPNALTQHFGWRQTLPKAEITRLVASKIPVWIGGRRSNVIIESSNNRPIEFQCWTDQLPGIVEWLPEKSFLRGFNLLSLLDILLAFVLFFIGVAAIPLAFLLFSNSRKSEWTFGGLLDGQTGFLFALILALVIIAAGTFGILWTIYRVAYRPYWTRRDAWIAMPLLVWGLIPPGFAMINQFVGGGSQDTAVVPDWTWSRIALVVCLTVVCTYFPLRIWWGDSLRAATAADFAVRPPRSWFRLTRPLRNNAVSWALKILGVAGLIAFWSPLSQPIFDALDANIQLSSSAFYARNFLQVVLTAPPAILLYIGYRLAQQPPVQITGDQRRPILFLRPFNDDQSASMQPRGFLPSLCGIDKSMGNYGDQTSERGRTKMSFLWTAVHPIRVLRLFFNRCIDTAEESIVRYFSQYAPIYAIGKPGEVLPTPGAIRLYPGEQWQDVVLEYLEKAQAVIVQPGTSEGVAWELQQIKQKVPHYRVLLALVSFQRDPEAYERLRKLLFEIWGAQLPRSLPFRDGPHFVWFDADWQPIIQETSYTCPLTWPFTGNTIHLSHTLQPFIQGMHGGDREPPRRARWRRGFAYQAVYVPTALLAVAVMIFPVLVLNGFTNVYRATTNDTEMIAKLPDKIGSSAPQYTPTPPEELGPQDPMQMLRDRSRDDANSFTNDQPRLCSGTKVAYEFSIDAGWKQTLPLSDDVDFMLQKEGVGIIEALSFANVQLSDLFEQSMAEVVRSSVEGIVQQTLPLASVTLTDDRWVTINGVNWRAFSMLQDYRVVTNEVRYSFYTCNAQGAVVIHLILPNTDAAPKFRDQFLATLKAPATDLDLMLSRANLPESTEYASSLASMTARLNPAWNQVNVEQKLNDMEDIGEALREHTQMCDLALQLGNEPFFGNLEIDVLGFADEPFDPETVTAEDCEGLVAERQALMASVFEDKINVEMKFLEHRVVERAGCQWLEFRFNILFSLDEKAKNSISVVRIAQRDGLLISISGVIDKQHPEVERLVLEAMDAFTFVD